MKKFGRLVTGSLVCALMMTGCGAKEEATTEKAASTTEAASETTEAASETTEAVSETTEATTEVTTETTTEATTEATTAEEATTEDASEEAKEAAVSKGQILLGIDNLDQQIETLISSRDVWTVEDVAFDHHTYAITDLDRNGRIEIVATVNQGSGLYSTSDFFEVKEDLSGVEKVSWDKTEGESEPDLGMSTCECYYKEDTGEYHYIFTDIMRVSAMEHHETTVAFNLKDSKIQIRNIASASVTVSENGEDVEEKCYDAAGLEISSDEYISLADDAFPNYKKQDIEINWIIPDTELESGITSLSDEQLKEELHKSAEGFTATDC